MSVPNEIAGLALLAEIETGDNSPRENDTVLDTDQEIADFLAGVEQRGLAKLSSGKLAGA